MKSIITKHKQYFTNKKFLTSVIISFTFLIIALIINFYAGTYATERASNSVTDIILSNTRAYDLDGFFVYGTMIFLLFIAFVLFLKPNKIPFTIKSIALFVVTRSIFISLTHLGPFPSQIVINSNFLNKFSFGADLFFSGHTGLPFLLALIFWSEKWVRNIFISFSLMFAVVVLLAHLHYSIDVLSAFFITYTIFHIALYIFKKDSEEAYLSKKAV
jgi:hypothetical protein